MTREIVIVRTGAANVASVTSALEALGFRTRVTSEAREIRAADRLVLPGVGSFRAAREALDANDLGPVLTERIRAGRATLAICLGLQLLAEGSDEAPGVPGLGILPGRARRFDAGLVVPHMGWNRVVPETAADFVKASVVTEGHAYFANTYRLAEAPAGWAVSTTTYGGRFVSAVERGAVVACQFHPELSSSFGRGLLERWTSREVVSC